MRLILRIDNSEPVDACEPDQAIHAPKAETATAAELDRNIEAMLALLATSPASSAAEAFAALRRAFPESRLRTRVEALRQYRACGD